MGIKCQPHELSETPRKHARLYYQTEHSLDDVLEPGYFDPAATSLRSGDIIELWAGPVSKPRFDELVVVRNKTDRASSSHLVEVAPLAEFRAARVPSGQKRKQDATKRNGR